MAEIIDLPQQGGGTAQQQLQEMYLYLYRMASDLNLNFQQIGFDGLTDDEQQLMNDLTRAEQTDVQKAEDSLYTGKHNYTEAATLKSLIIKTAQFVKNEVENMRIVLFGEESASGQFGDWKRRKGLRVDVTPDGVKQTYSYAEIVQGLQTFEINSKNYIKTGYLRTENMLPVYGVQVGKDIVTFDENGNETYHDGNKVAEFTAEALSFYANGTILAKYTGTKISFYIAGVEVMYIEAGKIYSTMDLELGSNQTVKVGNWQFNNNGLYGIAGGEQFAISPLNLLTGVDGVLLKPSDKLEILLRHPKFGTYEEKTFIFRSDQSARYHWESTHLSGATDRTACLDKVYQLGSIANPVFDLLGTNIYASEILPWNKTDYGEASNYPTASVISGIIGSSDKYWKDAYLYTVHYYSLSQSSSREYKEKIREMESLGDAIARLRPVRYRYKEKPDEERLGLIYEDTLPVMPEICVDSGGKKGINYTELIPVLLKEIQDLRARVKALEEKGD